MQDIFLNAGPENEGNRIDKFLSEELTDLSRSYIQKQIDAGNLLVNKKAVKANYKLKCDDEIYLQIPDTVIPDIIPQNIPINIIYEDDNVCIVNKPQGMVVHPAAGHFDGTLVNALLFHLEGRLSGINGCLRPGIVHRIDKDTSGLLIICKNDKSHQSIANQLKEHTCQRTYHAIVHGKITEDNFTIDKPIGRSDNDRKKMSIKEGGKEAVTHIKVLERFKEYTYVECRLETGRTHQIRVHMASIGHPLMGDSVYSGYKEPVHTEGQILHAKTIGFTDLDTGEFKLFDSDLPEYFCKILEYLREKNS